MTAGMSDEQFAQVRANGLAVVSTQLDGTLLVREPEGTLLELTRDGDLEPHAERPGRVALKDLPRDLTLTDLAEHGALPKFSAAHNGPTWQKP